MSTAVAERSPEDVVSEVTIHIDFLLEKLPPRVETDLEFQVAGDTLKSLSKSKSEVEKRKKHFLDPLNVARNRILDQFRPVVDKIVSHQKEVKRLMHDYEIEKERQAEKERLERQRKIQKEVEEDLRRADELRQKGGIDNRCEANEIVSKVETRQNIAVAQKTVALPKVDGRSFRKKFVAKIIDRSKLSDEYLIPDMDALNALAKARKGVNPPSGVAFIEVV